MRIETPGPVRKPLPLTPLVDVVFLLLMFFMLSSTFTKFGGMDLGRPAAASGEASAAAPAPGKVPGVIIAVSRGPRIRINGNETAIDRLSAQLDAYYAKGARSGVIALAQSAEVQDLVSVLERARLSKLRAIAVAR